MLAKLAVFCLILSTMEALKCDKAGTVEQLVGELVSGFSSWGNAKGDCPAGLDHCAWIPRANVTSFNALKTLDAYTKDTAYFGNIFTLYNSYFGGLCVNQQDCTTLKTTSAASCDGATTPCCCTGDMCNTKTASSLLSFASLLAIIAVTSLISSM